MGLPPDRPPSGGEARSRTAGTGVGQACLSCVPQPGAGSRVPQPGAGSRVPQTGAANNSFAVIAGYLLFGFDPSVVSAS